ncbi:Dinucleoside triphosphate hydrolase [Elasticomyces elasticus]|nr:Dinucleoside triphosphate hydrolase [Elasticomyces elasticus]
MDEGGVTEEEHEAMPPASRAIYFGSFLVTPQVFHTTAHSFALVNLKPLLPGHVLVCPKRQTPRFASLTPIETQDLFLTVQRVQRTLTRLYAATAFNVAIQDGEAAGQTVPHVHAHVIPRREGDMDKRGGGDKLYEMLEGEEGDVAASLREAGEAAELEGSGRGIRPDEGSRPARGEEEMRKEAEWLREEMMRDAEQ